MGIDITDPKVWRGAKKRKARKMKLEGGECRKLRREWKPVRDRSVYGSGRAFGSLDTGDPRVWRRARV